MPESIRERGTHQEKRDLMNKLDFRIYPSEDLKTMGIKCGLKLVNDSANPDKRASQDRCGKVVFGLPIPSNTVLLFSMTI